MIFAQKELQAGAATAEGGERRLQRLPMERLKDKVALVTGGSRGIGAIAKRLAHEGAAVSITYSVSRESADAVADAIARPLGGVVMAHAGDLRGRKQMFTLSIFLMALPTLGIELLPTYAKLAIWAPVLQLLLRILQGVAVGGEVPGAWVFVSEHVNPSHVGLACGILTGGLTGGILLGSVVATSLSIVMTHDQLVAYGWRIPFVLGGAFGLLAMYVRRLLAETPVFLELKARQALASEMPLKAVVRD